MEDKTKTVITGLQCPKCGCCDLRITDRKVSNIRHKGGIGIRIRECRHCGHRVKTHERVVDLKLERLRPEGE